MGQKKPIDLKKAAKRFTEKYYPQWLSRVDRIWEMLENIDPNSLQPESTNYQSQQGNSFGIAGEMEPELKECMSGIAVFAFTCKNFGDDDNISENEIKNQISIAQTNLNINAGLQTKLENVLSEILPSLFKGGADCLMPENITKQKTQERESRDFVVYLARSSGFGTISFHVSEEELHSRYLSDKTEYDIIVYQHNVEIKSIVVVDGIERIKFKSIDLYSNILILLTLFLKYKDDPLLFPDLYNCAWRGSIGQKLGIIDSDDIIDDLKAGVSTLRKCFNNIENFTIPNAKRKAGVYICKGDFRFCLILSKSMNQMYTLGED